MKKFFVAKNWGREEAPINFPSVQNKQIVDSSASKKAKKKKKKTERTDNNSEVPFHTGRGPIAPPPSPKTSPEPPQKSKSILNGRITKQKNKPKPSAKTIEKIVSEIPLKNSSSFEDKLKENLMGGRFRFINEQLYTSDSNSAKRLFEEDTSAFEAYHNGYRHQVEKWPLNPLNKIIKSIKKLPKDFVVGDFGCGEGKLAQSVPNKVFSFDLVSCREDIIATDMADTPLDSESINIAVYCLSLMGTNLNDYLLEANRVLKVGGLLLVAEIQSRFENLRQFIKSVETCGFEVVNKDTSVKLFYFFQFKKIKNVSKNANLVPFSLKPCTYRKR